MRYKLTALPIELSAHNKVEGEEGFKPSTDALEEHCSIR